jgi:hypothetical protein
LLNKFNKINRKKDTLNRPASESYLQSTLGRASPAYSKLCNIFYWPKAGSNLYAFTDRRPVAVSILQALCICKLFIRP